LEFEIARERERERERGGGGGVRFLLFLEVSGWSK